MNLVSKKAVKNLLLKYEIRPLKRFGQNFLIDRSILKKIITAANLQTKDIVLEIGPGIGSLTQELAKGAKRVIAVEKDSKMIKILKETAGNLKNVKVIKGDILKLNFQFPKNYKLVANLPYYIVSPVIRKFLESKNPPASMILMVQKEVAQRICAKPTRGRSPSAKHLAWRPKMSILAVSVQFYAKPEIISFVSKKSFWPQPKVDGAIIKLEVKRQKIKVDNNLFFRIVKAGFSQPRKQLINNLSKKLKIDRLRIKNWLLKNKIQPTQRAETLNIKNWINLAKSYQADC